MSSFVVMPAQCPLHRLMVHSTRHGYLYSGPVPWCGTGDQCDVDFAVKNFFILCVFVRVCVYAIVTPESFPAFECD